jgi:hypothetical protein
VAKATNVLWNLGNLDGQGEALGGQFPIDAIQVGFELDDQTPLHLPLLRIAKQVQGRSA